LIGHFDKPHDVQGLAARGHAQGVTDERISDEAGGA